MENAPADAAGFQSNDLPLAVDYDDNDSAFEDDSDLQSATTSIKSSITDYRFHHGRRYHAYREGAYWGPNDEIALESLDIAHAIWSKLIDGKLFLAPIHAKPQRALDVGCGTGIWAMDFADRYPDCQVIGTDLSPVQPREVPPNLQFEVDDAESEWLFTKNSFDFIHMRSMYGSVRDWPAMYGQVMEHLKPGAWFEQAEMSVVPRSEDGTVTEDSMLAQWGRVSLESGDRFGKTLRIVDEMKQYLVDGGFQDVTEVRFRLPMSPWTRDPMLKELGKWNMLHWHSSLETWATYLFTHYLGWSIDTVRLFASKMRKELRMRSIHAYHEVAIVYARKPGGTGI